MRDLLEPIPVPDIFVSGLGAIEDIGDGNLRFYLYVLQNSPSEENAPDKIVVAKIVGPMLGLADALMMLARAARGAHGGGNGWSGRRILR